jgi:hypothetical protein
LERRIGMSRLDRMLEEKRREYEKLQPPDSMEYRLKAALQEKKTRRKLPLSRIAAMFLIGAILTYNSSTLAFYGKQLIGYETVMDGTLLQLSRMGEGQVIDKNHLFSDGLEVQLDVAMLDGNGLVFFYTIEDTTKSKDINDVHVQVLPDIPFVNAGSSGAGEIMEEDHMQKWVFTTDEPPPFFIRKVTLELTYMKEDGSSEYGEISFRLDRNKAVGETVKMGIDRKVELAGRTIEIEDISMSSISTVVKGEIQDLISLGMDRLNEEYMMPHNMEMSLYADGIEIERKGAGMSTDMKGTRFDVRFDAIPKDTKDLRLELDSVSVHERLNMELEIAEGDTLEIRENEILINSIEESDGRTYVTITTGEGTRIPGVRLIADGNHYDLLETSESTYEKKQDEAILNTRTLEFDGSGEDLKLSVSDIRYTKNYNLAVYEESIE